MTAKIRIVLNQNSGTAAGKQQEIFELFRAYEILPEIVALTRSTNLEELAETPDTVLVAAGGDGTVNSVASAVAKARRGAVMAVLPIGTLNHFAKDLHLPLELPAAVALIATSTSTAPVDAAEVNDRIFVNNSSLGFYPAMVTERERLKKVGLNKWLSMALASLGAFVRFRQLTVQLAIGGKVTTCTTPFLFVGNNEYKMEGTQIGTREHLDRGRLYLYLAPRLTRLGAFRLTLAALRGAAREIPNYQEFCVEEFTVKLRGRHVRVSLDGEIRKLSSPLRYRTRPAALRVVTPDAAHNPDSAEAAGGNSTSRTNT